MASLLFKFIVIGNSNVGKSCLLLRFYKGEFREAHQMTIGVEFVSKDIKVDNQSIHIQIWDTAGAENFRSITRAYYKGVTAALIVYDITSRDSFNSVSFWVNELQENADSNVVKIIVGNKADLQREVSEAEGRELANKAKCLFIETSAYSGSNVNSTFELLAKAALAQGSAGGFNHHETLNRIKSSRKKHSKSCC